MMLSASEIPVLLGPHWLVYIVQGYQYGQRLGRSPTAIAMERDYCFPCCCSCLSKACERILRTSTAKCISLSELHSAYSLSECHFSRDAVIALHLIRRFPADLHLYRYGAPCEWDSAVAV